MDHSKIYISTIASDAVPVAQAHGFGLEIAEYCTAWNMDDAFPETDAQVQKKLEGIEHRILHAPFNELFPCAIDPRARALAKERYKQALSLAKRYGAAKVVIGVGEMGIGNTTTSAAVLAVLLDWDPDSLTGRGGGITDESYIKKKQVIKTAIEINRPDRNDAIDVLAKVGGFDLAAMCGAFIGAALTRRPVVIDGFISAVAALCACRLCPNVRGYLIPSHASFEVGYQAAMDAMELQPMLLLGMRLGEGSGCPLAFQILEAACAIINDMATFDEAGIDDGYLDEIREGDKFSVEGKQ